MLVGLWRFVLAGVFLFPPLIAGLELVCNVSDTNGNTVFHLFLQGQMLGKKEAKKELIEME